MLTNNLSSVLEFKLYLSERILPGFLFLEKKVNTPCYIYKCSLFFHLINVVFNVLEIYPIIVFAALRGGAFIVGIGKNLALLLLSMDDAQHGSRNDR